MLNPASPVKITPELNRLSKDMFCMLKNVESCLTCKDNTRVKSTFKARCNPSHILFCIEGVSKYWIPDSS